MKTKIFTLLFFVMACVGMSHATIKAVTNGTCGNDLTWTLNSKDSTLLIEGSGEMTSHPWSDYKKYVAYVSLPSGITRIMEDAFLGSPVKELTIFAVTPPAGGANSGIEAPNCKLLIPKGSKDSYANSIWWEDFASIEEFILCEPYLFEETRGPWDGNEFIWRGKSINHAGIYYDSLLTVVGGCDSVYKLDVSMGYRECDFICQSCDSTTYTDYSVPAPPTNPYGGYVTRNLEVFHQTYKGSVADLGEFSIYEGANTANYLPFTATSSNESVVMFSATSPRLLQVVGVGEALIHFAVDGNNDFYGSDYYFLVRVTEPKSTLEEETITVRLDPQSCSNWQTVRLYYWGYEVGDELDGLDWPGIYVSQDEDGWYSYTFYKTIKKANIIWNNGSDQTIDITNVAASTCYALNSTTGTQITVSIVDCPSAQPVINYSHVKIGDLYYDLDPSYKTAQVVRSDNNSYSGEIIIPETIEYNEEVYTVSSIGYRAFRSCTDLTSVEIPNTVTSIDSYAFYSCYNLTYITCLAETPPYLAGYYSLESGTTVYVPCGTLEAYRQASYWYNANLIALPSPASYDIQFAVSDSELGHIEIIKEWNCASKSVTAQVVLNKKVRFEGWSDGYTEQIYTLYPAGDTMVIANLVEDDTQFIVNVTADESKGTVTGGGTYYYGDTIVIRATPNSNYAFRGWSDGVYANPRYLQPNNYNIEAIFGERKMLHSEGTDFWVTFLRGDEGDSQCKTATLSLTLAAIEPCVVTVENPANGKSETIALPAGTTRNVKLYEGGICNYSRLQNEWDCYTNQPDSIQTTALHVTSNKNISVFAANHKLKTFDVTNVLPVSDLGDEYYIQTYPASDHEGEPQGTHFAIVATEDNTIVDYVLTAHVQSAHATEPGVLYSTPILNAGEVYYIWTGLNDRYESDLSGSYVKARDGKRIAVFQGAPHTNIPYMVRDRDHLYSQAMPIAYWGNEFVVPSSLHHKRDIIRVMAINDGTEVYVNGKLVHTFDFVNGDDNDKKRTFEFELGEEYVNSYAKGILPSPLVADSSCYISTSAPSSVHLFMTSNRYDNDRDSYSESINDPAMLYINPVEQMVKEACFSTYTTKQINELHYINIIARANAVDNVVLKGNSNLRPLASEFRPVNGNPDYAFARVQIQSDVYTLSSSQGFIAYVYGFGEKESYAFSVGGKSVYQEPKMRLILNCDETMGSVIGAGEYDFNETIEISAIPNEGYEFVHWTDGNEDATRTIVMNDDKELAALFREIGVDPIEDVVVDPGETTAGIHWPEVPFAYSYCIIVWYDAGHTIYVCKLYYNAFGMRIGSIFYAYDRKTLARRAPHANEPNVIQFADEIEGLDPNTTYYYTVTASDEEGDVLDTKEGQFTTKEESEKPEDPDPEPSNPEEPAQPEDQAINNISDDITPVKIVRDGQILILRGERVWTVEGQEVK